MAALDIRYCDNQAREMGRIGDYLSARFQWKRNDVGSGTLILPGDSPHAERLRELAPSPNKPYGDTVPVSLKFRGEKWTGRAFTYENTGVPGDKTLTVQLVSDWYHMRSLLAWPRPAMPLWVQWPQIDPFIGPIDVAVKYYWIKNAIRYNIPIAIVWPDGKDFFNGKKWANFAARMAPMDELFQDALVDTEANVVLYMWWPGDPQPDPRQTLTKPTLVLDVHGNRERLHVKWDESLGGGIVQATTAGKTSTAAHIIVGGKSYDFINNLAMTGANALINTALGFLGLGAVGNIIGDLFNDSLFAFNQFTNWNTVNSHGPFYLREAYQNGGAGGFTADALQAGSQGLYDHKARTSVSFEAIDGMPWKFGEDYRVSDIVQAKVDGVWHKRVVDSVTVEDDRGGGVRVTPLIGDPDVGEPGVARFIRRNKSTLKWVKAMSLQN